jgi:hypothetical protein
MRTLLNYASSDQSQGLLVTEECRGFLFVQPSGVMDLATASRLMSLLGDYSQQREGISVVLLVDNSKVKSIETDARSYVLNLIKKKPLIKTAVSFGTNVFIRNFMKIFLGLVTSGNIVTKIFKTKAEALEYCQLASSCSDAED